jgi:hypothetical protein
MSHKGRYDNLAILAKGALNFLSSALLTSHSEPGEKVQRSVHVAISSSDQGFI